MIEPGTPFVSRNTPPPVAQVQNTSTIAAQLIVNNSRNTGSLDIALLHTDLQRIDAQNPGLGLGVRMAIEAQLIPVQRGELARAETTVAATTPDTGDGPDVGTLALDLAAGNPAIRKALEPALGKLGGWAKTVANAVDLREENRRCAWCDSRRRDEKIAAKCCLPRWSACGNNRAIWRA